MSHSKEATKTSPDPWAVCLSVCPSVKAHLPMDSNQGPSPFFPASGEGVTTWRELQGLCPEPLRGGGWAVRSPEQCQQPLLCVQSSQQMPELGRWKAPCFIFVTQHALWRHPAGCLALQNLFIYVGAEEIGSFSASPGILSWGSFTAASRGPCGTETQPESRPGKAWGSAVPCLESCCGILA